ncbi:hypothetical protein HanIR_Chr12g0580011 [Helianthus annuus]|nr:hypothetical protein HanIR_Chr12g0580011 [Helianthus annuus]
MIITRITKGTFLVHCQKKLRQRTQITYMKIQIKYFFLEDEKKHQITAFFLLLLHTTVACIK